MATKGSITLSVEMLVVVVISIVMLGMGIALLYQFLEGAGDTKDQLDQRTEQELQRLLIDQGQRVALPLKTAVLYGGESTTIGLGILNINTLTTDFYIGIEKLRAVDADGQDITDRVDTGAWFLFTEEKIALKAEQHHIEPLLLEVPTDAPKGQYIFAVRIFTSPSHDSQTQYGNTQQLVVSVR